MAIFHLHASIISRSSGRSCVASSAYISADKLTNEYDGLTHDYTRKQNVAYSEIMLPDHAPKEFQDRSTLWNAVEKSEKQINAQTARQVEIGIPNELPFDQAKELVRNYVKDTFVKDGMCADMAIHWKDGNHHAHIQLTTREVNPDGTFKPKSSKEYKCKNPDGTIKYFNGNDFKNFASNQGYEKLYKCKYKNHSAELTKSELNQDQWKDYKPTSTSPLNAKINTNDWNNLDNVELWRKEWCEKCNSQLKEKGLPLIDHRSYERQGIDQIPTIHLGSTANALEKRGIRTERGDINRRIARANEELRSLSKAYGEEQRKHAMFVLTSNNSIKAPNKVEIATNERSKDIFGSSDHLRDKNVLKSKLEPCTIEMQQVKVEKANSEVEKTLTSIKDMQKSLDEVNTSISRYNSMIQKYDELGKQINTLEDRNKVLESKLFKPKKEIQAIQDRINQLKNEQEKYHVQPLYFKLSAQKNKLEKELNKTKEVYREQFSRYFIEKKLLDNMKLDRQDAEQIINIKNRSKNHSKTR